MDREGNPAALRGALEDALDAAEGSDARYSISEALQIHDAERE